MKIIRDGDWRLEVVDHDFLLGGFFFLFGGLVSFAGFSNFAGKHYVGGLEALGPGGDFLVGLVGMMLSVAGLALCSCNRFVFDRARHELFWSRTGLFGSKRGRVPFSRLGRAFIQYAPMKGPEWGRDADSRLAMELENRALPFSEIYEGNSAMVWEKGVKAINDFIDYRSET